MTDDSLQFLADSLMAQELALTCLLESLLKFHPEITADFISNLDTKLKSGAIPTKGAWNNLNELRHTLSARQPSVKGAH